MPTLLFLGYDRTQTRLIDLIEALGWAVDHTADPVGDLGAWDRVVSFGYRHILRQPVLDTARRPVLNRHIGYLPWNRGAHPLHWAAHDGTPVGVTVHEIDSGVGTGPVCFQRRVDIDVTTETFAGGHKRLFEAMEALFEAHAEALLSGRYETRAQQGQGSVRRVRDLPDGFTWSETITPVIAPVIARLKASAHG